MSFVKKLVKSDITKQIFHPSFIFIIFEKNDFKSTYGKNENKRNRKTTESP